MCVACYCMCEHESYGDCLLPEGEECPIEEQRTYLAYLEAEGMNEFYKDVEQVWEMETGLEPDYLMNIL